MFELIIIIFIASTIISPITTQSFKPDEKFIEDSKKYVLLHLVEELSRTSEMSKTRRDRNILRRWHEARASILTDIFLFHLPGTNKYFWYKNWQERLKYFQDLQKDFFNDVIVKNYDKRRAKSPWPRIVFDTISGTPILHPDQPRSSESIGRSFTDPFATDKDIQELMYLYRPLTDDEKKEWKKVDEARDTAINANEYGMAKQYIEDYTGHVIQNNVKKYSIVSSRTIQSLRQVNYALTLKSLEGKRVSDLDYQRALLRAERLIAQLEVWEKHGVNAASDKSNAFFDSHVPKYLRFLNNDVVYRKYLNFHDSFFSGNVIYGHKYRYDDPANFGLDFEENAHFVLGARFNPVHELYKEIRELNVKSDNFKDCTLNDLPTITLFLERLKTWTFWFPLTKFNRNQWFFKSIPSQGEKYYSMIPKDADLMNANAMLNKVNNIMNRGQIGINSKQIISQLNNNGDHFIKQLNKDDVLLKRIYFNLKFKTTVPPMWTNRLLRYMRSLSEANSLLVLETKPELRKLLLNMDSPKKSLPDKIEKNVDVAHQDISDLNYHENIEDVFTDPDDLVANLHDLFDPSTNKLTQSADKKSTSDFSSTSGTGSYDKSIHSAGYVRNNEKSVLQYYLTNNIGNGNSDGKVVKRMKIHH